MNIELLTALIGILSTTMGSVISWVLARRKYNSEVDNTIIVNMQQSLDFYKELSDDNKSRLQDLQDKNRTLEKEVADNKSELQDLQGKNRILEKEVVELREQVWGLMRAIREKH